MQTPIAQAAALAIFGNDVLRGYARTDFWPRSTVFTFCKRVRFVTLDRTAQGATETPFAESPIEWISKLRDAGTGGLRLHQLAGNDAPISDRMSVGFVGGGGNWLIEALGGELSDLWQARWLVGDRNDPERKVWDVTYGRVEAGRVQLPFRPHSPATVKRELDTTLSRIESFATHQKLQDFAKAFREARALLSSDQPLAKTYHVDLAPNPALPLEAKQLLGAAQAAWVFGGMGSWNDLGFDGEDQQEYDRLSGRLFSLLIDATCSAANASAG